MKRLLPGLLLAAMFSFVPSSTAQAAEPTRCTFSSPWYDVKVISGTRTIGLSRLYLDDYTSMLRSVGTGDCYGISVGEQGNNLLWLIRNPEGGMTYLWIWVVVEAHPIDIRKGSLP